MKMCHCVTWAGVALDHSFVTTPITSFFEPAVTSMLTSSCHSDREGKRFSGSVETRSHVSAMAVPSAVRRGSVYWKYVPSWRPLAMISLPLLALFVVVIVFDWSAIHVCLVK